MASTTSLITTILVVLSILSISATASRPCKTLFISSYSVSLRRLPSPSGFVTVLTEIRQLRPIRFDYQDDQNDAALPDEPRRQPQMPLLPLSTDDLTSLRDRTKDILSVVVALLFGVGCGALTAATMYLAWSLFCGRHSFDDDEDEVFSPKKMGYVTIPEAVKAAPEKEAAAAPKLLT